MKLSLSLSLAALAVSTPCLADTAPLVDEITIIDNIPIGTIGSEDQFGSPGFAVNRGDGVTTGFVDAAVLTYDFGTVTSVSKAELTIDVDIIFDDAGMSPTIELFTYADDGAIQLTDIFLGAGVVRDSFTYATVQTRTIDVTTAVNDALLTSQFVGFRFENSRSPFELPAQLEGIHLNPVLLEYDVGGCGTVYCDSSQNPNNAASIGIDTCDSGSTGIVVSLANGPPGQFAYLLVGNGNDTVSQPPGAKGDLCVAGGSCLGSYGKDVGRIDSAGTFSTDIQNAVSDPCAGGVNIDPGATWNFQYWHRQPMGQQATFSAALAVTFR